MRTCLNKTAFGNTWLDRAHKHDANFAIEGDRVTTGSAMIYDAKRLMSAISRMGPEYPRRATASIARPSRSVVVIIVGATRLSMG
jgi:hypothetical protein